MSERRCDVGVGALTATAHGRVAHPGDAAGQSQAILESGTTDDRAGVSPLVELTDRRRSTRVWRRDQEPTSGAGLEYPVPLCARGLRRQIDREPGRIAIEWHQCRGDIDAMPRHQVRKQKWRAIDCAREINVPDSVSSLSRRGEEGCDAGRCATIQPAAVESVGDDLWLDRLEDGEEIRAVREIAKDVGGQRAAGEGEAGSRLGVGFTRQREQRTSERTVKILDRCQKSSLDQRTASKMPQCLHILRSFCDQVNNKGDSPLCDARPSPFSSFPCAD